MTRWTEKQLQEYISKKTHTDMKTMDSFIIEEQAGEEPESVLAGKIMKWAKDHEYPCQCYRQSSKARGFLVPGWPD